MAVFVGLLLVFDLDQATGAAPVQHLYYLPLTLAAIVFGFCGGVVASFSAIVFYHLANPRLLSFSHEHWDFVQVGLFLAVGLITAKLTQDRRRFHLLATTDDLTGLHNLRSFEDKLAGLVRASRAGRTPLALLALDVDHLKSLNDAHGHLAGAEAVRTVGHIIGELVPPEAVACRYGGDEFVVAVHRCAGPAAHRLAESIRQAVFAATPVLAGLPFPVRTLSVSVGVVSRVIDADASSRSDADIGEELFCAADAALYQSKKSGRNHVCVSNGAIGGASLVLRVPMNALLIHPRTPSSGRLIAADGCAVPSAHLSKRPVVETTDLPASPSSVLRSASRRRLAYYGIAVLSTAMCLAARQLLTPGLGPEFPDIMLLPAITFSAWLGGLGPGTTATVLSVIGSAYLWVPSTRFFARLPTPRDALGIALFCGVGLFISALAEVRVRAQFRTERQIDDVRQTQERERRARNEAEHANTAKDEFLAILAHELRQPLSAIVAALAVMRQQLCTDVPPSTERSIAVMQRQTAHLQRLVEDLLDASRIVRGQVTLHRHPLNAVEVIRDAIEAARPRADERRQRLECRLPDGPVIVDADPTRLLQVMLNVLSNAIRYTPPGGEIRLVVEGDSGWLTIRVLDSGDGIAGDDLPHIFSLFTRAGERRGIGLGIGLAVARGVVELHGGTIDASSDGPGRGSEFRIALPLAEQCPVSVRSP